MSKEQAVREAAVKLRDTIADAEAAGYRVAWPSSASGLAGIAISETAAVKPEAAPAPAAKPRFGKAGS